MAGAKFELSFNQSQVNAVIQEMAATPAEVKKASDRAARHTMNAMKTLIVRAISSQFKIPVSALRSRVTVRKYSADNPVWIMFVGLNSMPVDKVGPISQNPTGLKHRNGLVKGGFDTDVFKNGKRGWIRKKRARDLNLDLPGLEKWKHSVTLRGPLAGRFPIVRISTDLGGAASTIIAHFQSKAKGRFLARFEHELKHIKGLT